MLTTVVSDWPESEGYGLGIAEITSLMDKSESSCALPGTSGSRPGTRRSPLASEDGRHVVIMTNTVVESDETREALGRLAWASYCS
jgi:hypothetical protein